MNTEIDLIGMGTNPVTEPPSGQKPIDIPDLDVIERMANDLALLTIDDKAEIKKLGRDYGISVDEKDDDMGIQSSPPVIEEKKPQPSILSALQKVNNGATSAMPANGNPLLSKERVAAIAEEMDKESVILEKKPEGNRLGFLSNPELTGDGMIEASTFVDDPSFTIESDAPERVGSVAGNYLPKGIANIVGMKDEAVAIETALNMNIPLILIGHTGIAKTTILAKEHEKRKWPYRTITCNGSVEVDTLVGKWIANPKEGMVYKLGILPFCMKYGISLGVQEINFLLPEVLVLLHEFVDEGHITLLDLDPSHPEFIIKPHPNFRLFGTMNPPELYAGAHDLSPALARRCLVKRVDELPPDEEAQVVSAQSKVDSKVATQLVAIGKAVRESFGQGKTLYYLSTADLIMWGRLMIEGGLSAMVAADLAIISKASESDHEFLNNTIRLQFDPSYSTTPVGDYRSSW